KASMWFLQRRLSAAQGRGGGPPEPRYRPSLDPLEDRTLLSTSPALSLTLLPAGARPYPVSALYDLLLHRPVDPPRPARPAAPPAGLGGRVAPPGRREDPPGARPQDRQHLRDPDPAGPAPLQPLLAPRRRPRRPGRLPGRPGRRPDTREGRGRARRLARVRPD